MTKTDHPLKRLVTAFIDDFAAWLLNSTIKNAESRNIELSADLDPIQSDQVFHITLPDDKTVLLHIEFQGRTSHKPMPLRMLDYMARLRQTYRDIEMHNVVFYVGYGAGKKDKGHHQVKRPDGKKAITWQYDVIHLWNTPAEELLALGRPTLLPLIGQMKITKPEEIIPKVIKQLKTVTEPEQQRRLFTELMALISDKEIITMLEQLIEHDELLMDTPFLLKIKTESQKEGLKKGIEKGKKVGLEEGKKVGLEEGELITFRQNILSTLVLRFDPRASLYQKIMATLNTITTKTKLEKLFTTAIQCEDVAQFQEVLATIQEDNNDITP